jgi:ATP-dependent Clp protease ATP-binding subunit ClpC
VFERYTERARRVLFFARYEASQLGSLTIETDHLLLGMIREGNGLTNRLFANSQVSLESVRQEIEGRAVFREKLATSVEIPFSQDAIRVLQRAAEEANRLRHDYIGTEHLLLGLLSEERAPAAALLVQRGMRADEVRKDLVQLLGEGDASGEDWQSILCCFCGEKFLAAPFAVSVVVSRADGQGGSQTLYAHTRCLRSHLRPEAALLTDTGIE